MPRLLGIVCTLHALVVAPAMAGTPPQVDGILSTSEWKDAEEHELSGGGTLRLLRSGDVLYLGLENAEGGIGSILLHRDDRVEVLHASAALGTAVYEPDGESWKLVRKFTWCCRGETTGTGEERATLRQQDGWIASNMATGAPNQMEYAIDLPTGETRLAVTWLDRRDFKSVSWWPADPGDAVLAPVMLTGPLPETVSFTPEKWLLLEPASK